MPRLGGDTSLGFFPWNKTSAVPRLSLWQTESCITSLRAQIPSSMSWEHPKKPRSSPGSQCHPVPPSRSREGGRRARSCFSCSRLIVPRCGAALGTSSWARQEKRVLECTAPAPGAAPAPGVGQEQGRSKAGAGQEQRLPCARCPRGGGTRPGDIPRRWHISWWPRCSPRGPWRGELSGSTECLQQKIQDVYCQKWSLWNRVSNLHTIKENAPRKRPHKTVCNLIKRALSKELISVKS